MNLLTCFYRIKLIRLCWPGNTAISKKTRDAHTILERIIIEERKIMWTTV